MTREEAIKRLEIHKSKSIYVDSIAEAIDMAIEALKTQDVVEELTQDLADSLNDAYDIGYNAAKREIALSVEYERAYQRGKADATKWIPVSEREPEKSGTYLTTTANGSVCTDHYYANSCDVTGRHWAYYRRREPVAWMPLPEPYRKENDNVSK